MTVSGNYLYVVDSYGSVGQYNVATGAVINQFLISGMYMPYGVAVLGNNLYTSDSGLGFIEKYTTSGQTVNMEWVTGLADPTGLAASENYVFVANYGDNTVSRYNSSGVGGFFQSFIAGPRGVAVSGNDLFVAYGNNIGEYDATTGATINATLVTGLVGTGAIATAAPEPSVLGLLGFGLLALLAFRISCHQKSYSE